MSQAENPLEREKAPPEVKAGHRKAGRFWVQLSHVVVLLIALGYLYEGRRLDLWREAIPGPGFMPLLLGIALAAISILLFVQEFRRSPSSSGPEFFLRMPAWITAGMIAYILLLPILGYGLCNFLLMLLCLRLYEPHGWKADLFGSAGTSIALYLVFVWLLRIDLPLGFLGR